MKQNKVAIITRTKNRNILLNRAIHSVLGQTYTNWLMVIVNDGGQPESVDQLVAKHKQAFNGRCQVMHNPHSLGMEAASNKGIKSCDSEYVIIHDDDDSWQPTFLEACVAFMDDNTFSSVAGVITYSTRYIETVDNEKVTTKHTEPFNVWLKSVTLYRMASSNVFPPISFLYKRTVFDEIGYYRESLPVLGDWEFNLRFIERYDIGLIPEELANYHHRLQISEGELGNSVIKDAYKHKFYDTLLRNELLRKDLKRKALGMGYLVNLSESFENVHMQIAPLETVLHRMRESKMMRWIKKAFRL